MATLSCPQCGKEEAGLSEVELRGLDQCPNGNEQCDRPHIEVGCPDCHITISTHCI